MSETKKTLWEIITDTNTANLTRVENITNYFNRIDVPEKEVLIAEDILLGIYQGHLNNNRHRQKENLINQIKNIRSKLEIKNVNEFLPRGLKNKKSEEIERKKEFIISSIRSNYKGDDVDYSSVVDKLKINGMEEIGDEKITPELFETHYENKLEETQEKLKKIVNDVGKDENLKEEFEKIKENKPDKKNKIQIYEEIEKKEPYKEFIESYQKLDYMDNGTNERVLSRATEEIASFINAFNEKVKFNKYKKNIVNSLNNLYTLQSEDDLDLNEQNNQNNNTDFYQNVIRQQQQTIDNILNSARTTNTNTIPATVENPELPSTLHETEENPIPPVDDETPDDFLQKLDRIYQRNEEQYERAINLLL